MLRMRYQWDDMLTKAAVRSFPRSFVVGVFLGKRLRKKMVFVLIICA